MNVSQSESMEYSDPPPLQAVNSPTKTLVAVGSDELSAANSKRFLRQVRSGILPEHRCIEIDLSQTTFVDSSGLGTFIALRNQMKSQGGTVRLLNPTPSVQQLLKLTRFDVLFDCVEPAGQGRSPRSSPQIVDSVKAV